MVRSVLRILRKDLVELGLPLLPVALLAVGGCLALVFFGDTADPLLLAVTASLCVLAGVVFPTLVIFREKTRKTWNWLRLLSPHPRALVSAKLLVSFLFYGLFSLALLPGWLVHDTIGGSSLRIAVWFVMTAAGWILGCVVFVLVVAVRRGYLAVILGLCSIEMFASAALMLGEANGALSLEIPTLSPGEAFGAVILAGAAGLGFAVLAVELGARFTRDGA